MAQSQVSVERRNFNFSLDGLAELSKTLGFPFTFTEDLPQGFVGDFFWSGKKSFVKPWAKHLVLHEIAHAVICPIPKLNTINFGLGDPKNGLLPELSPGQLVEEEAKARVLEHFLANHYCNSGMTLNLLKRVNEDTFFPAYNWCVKKHLVRGEVFIGEEQILNKFKVHFGDKYA